MDDRNRNEENASDDENIEDNDEEGCIRIDDIYIPPPPRHFDNEQRSGPRLILHQIVNVNFKSYAGEKIVGPFHQRFSAIVGPNGSGKSNVIDSMLFVFGYRANKIRSKKVSYLIHNSKEHPNVTSCKVAVHFKSIIDKEGDHYDVVPNSEFVISRTAFKDNTNYYELNGKRVQFKQIAQLLRSYGVDLDHNRFLILQGEVEQIALMKPKGQQEGDTGMLEFLEDIIGTTRFKEPLEKLHGKVELLTETRVEKLNRLRVAEKEKKELEEPMQEAVEYLRMENSIMHLQHQIYQVKKHETVKSINEEEEKYKELENDLKNLTEEMKKIHDEREEKQKVMKEKSDKWKVIQNEKDSMSKELANLQNNDEALHAEMVESNKIRKDCIASVKSENAKLEQLRLAPKKHEERIAECEALVEKNAKKREKEEVLLAQLMGESEEKTRPLIEQRSELETKLIAKKKEVDQAQSKYALAKKKLDIYTSNEQTEQTKLEEMKASLEIDIATLKERKEQLASFTSKIGPTEKSLRSAKKDLADLEAKERALQEQLNSKRAKYDEQKCAMYSSRSRNRVINSLMEQKKLGNFPGILGRLGDLGAIDAKYDVAISTACGALDNIVVDTVDTAQKCIDFLRKNNIGRASFIPLEKQQRFKDHCRQRIKTPENVARLFDLIRVENENVLVAFYYALQDTLVADHLDQATRIAYGAQRFRVVTLKGELIELSGTMSGGGRTALRGRMGQSVVRSEPSAVDLDKLSSELDEIFEECNRCKAAIPQLQQQVDSLTKSLHQMQRDCSKFEIDVRAINDRLPLLRQQLKQQEIRAKESVSDPKQVKKMTAEVEALEKELERVEGASKSVEDQVKSINDEIDKVSGGKIKEVQKRINELSKSIEKAKADMTKSRGGIKSAERDIKNCEQRIEHDQSEVKRNEDRLRTINEERKEIEKSARQLTEKISQLEEQLEERDQMLGDLRDKLATSQARESKMKHVKVELDHKFTEKGKLVKELKQKVPELERKMAAMKLHGIPNEQQEELRVLNEEELDSLTDKMLQAKLLRAKERMPQEVPNLQLIREYQEKDELYLKRAEELDVITTERNKVRNFYDMIKRKRSAEFLCGFDVITKKLKEMYQMITLGGDAELELVDSIDPFSEGVVFSVRPPKKSWKNINNLSGGEKTLSSLALVFALHHYRPTPLYFMDEIDAALDFKNVSIVGHYINERTKNAQFIVISLRSNMFELADYMVGIYKTYNSTKAVCLNLSLFYANNGLQPPSQDLCSQNPNNYRVTNNHHEVLTGGTVASTNELEESRQQDRNAQSVSEHRSINGQQEEEEKQLPIAADKNSSLNNTRTSSQRKRAGYKSSSSPDSSQSCVSDPEQSVQRRRSKRRRQQ